MSYINTVLDMLEERYKNVLPVKEVTPYELGVLVGQQQIINSIKHHIEVEGVKGRKVRR